MTWWWCAAAWAGGFELPPQAASTGGMAHTGVAFTDLAASAWHNPAALADGGGLRLEAGLTLARAQLRADALDGSAQTSTVSPLGTPPALSVGYGQAWWAVAAHVGTPFAGGVVWPEGWPGRFESLSSSPRFVRTAVSVAGRAGPVALSAGLHVDAGSLRIERATDHVTEEGRVTLALRGAGVGGDASILVRAGRHATIGATYKSRTHLPLHGEADFDLPPAFAAGRPDQAVTSSWTLPDRLSWGLAWTAERWRVGLDGAVTLWSVNDVLPLDFAEPETPDAEQVNGWRDTVALRVGVEGRVHDAVALRAGLSVDGIPGAPSPPDRLQPSSPDATRVSGAVGLGIRAHRWVSVDGWVEPMALLRRASTSPDALAASYGGWAVAGGVGLRVQQPARQAAAEVPPLDSSPAQLPPQGPWSAPPSPEGASDAEAPAGEVGAAPQAPAAEVPATTAPLDDPPPPEPSTSPWGDAGTPEGMPQQAEAPAGEAASEAPPDAPPPAEPSTSPWGDAGAPAPDDGPVWGPTTP